MQNDAIVENANSNTEQVAEGHAPHADTVVVGGGISGLTAAWHLANGGTDVRLIESRPVVGGSIDTEERDGFLLEKGPFNVMVRDPAFEELLTAMGDSVKVVSASDEAKNRYIYRRGRLHAVPTGPIPFLKSPLLSLPGRLRALRGLLLSRRGKAQATTLEEFATRRFGKEVADSIVSAAIAGILAGDIRRLNAYACFPVLEDFDRKSFSPMGRTLRRIPDMIRKKKDPAKQRLWKGLVSIDRGLGGLCRAMAEPLGDGLVVDTRVEAIHRHGQGYRLELARHGAREQLSCRRLILATPAAVTAQLLEDLAPEASRLLNTIESASLTVLNLAYRREDVAHPLDGFGFLVPHNEPDFPLMGALFADSAFPHHAPSEYRLLRVFIGGSRTRDVIGKPPEELLATARAALGEVLGVKGDPVLVDVCPYPDAIPQYYLDHVETVAGIRQGIEPLADLHLAGNYLDGVSINDCVKLGKQVATEVMSAAPAQD